jgi:hypothetical protein
VVLILSEAAVGAGLVLFEMVADNQSMARAMFMGTHLVNTFLLVAALTTSRAQASALRCAARVWWGAASCSVSASSCCRG